MQPQDSTPNAPICHRCKEPMMFSSQEMVGDKKINVFRCENCDRLEAFEVPNA